MGHKNRLAPALGLEIPRLTPADSPSWSCTVGVLETARILPLDLPLRITYPVLRTGPKSIHRLHCRKVGGQCEPRAGGQVCCLGLTVSCAQFFVQFRRIFRPMQCAQFLCNFRPYDAIFVQFSCNFRSHVRMTQIWSNSVDWC